MAPVRANRRVSGDSPAQHATSPDRHMIPTKTAATPIRKSPIKKRKGITLEQKQALVENLQLEITDRARRLRAQYHAQAQSLRSRVEMRVNRIPRSLLKSTMQDLVAKCAEQQKKLAAAARPPPVPEKDFAPRASPIKTVNASQPASRPRKRLSEDMAGDKENQGIDNPKKKHRGGPAHISTIPEAAQILSPTSTNARYLPRERTMASPAKPAFSRPASPTKAPTTARSALSNMVERAKAARPAPTRKTTTSSTTSSASAAPSAAPAPAASRTRRAAPAASKPPQVRPATRTGRRVSESSDGSTATVVKKPAAAKATAATGAKRTVMGTIRKGVAASTAKKAAATATAAAAASKATAASTAGSTRVLRKRG
ncbi:hypothetical protein D7B24_006327 [Verticillium nonalfalfae]|uniref:Borealin N-terminal domain-containing protein n=1 Tax=Verticillium nonalfalfae TaxID=1051616 RepID=A0A3M9YDH6_9PEZI|nr:uncharacterized protein D7B24_006327 [Verticillium nonalfalfae]RNJ57170.1 hypothetical protein D7B24_006327 [Verticillium nonalfalfae]